MWWCCWQQWLGLVTVDVVVAVEVIVVYFIYKRNNISWPLYDGLVQDCSNSIANTCYKGAQLQVPHGLFIW